LSGHGQGILQFPREVDILDQNTLNLDTPSHRNFLDNLLNTLRNFLPSFNHILKDSRTKDVAKRGLSPLDQGGTDVADAKGRFVGVDDVVVDDRGNVHVDVVFGHADLGGDFDNGDFDVDLLQFLTQTRICEISWSRARLRIDSGETWIDGTVVLAEFQDETSLTFVD
jgi:hypothetical protein